MSCAYEVHSGQAACFRSDYGTFYLFPCSSQRYSDYISPAQFHEACIDLATDLKEENGSKLDEFGFPRGAKFRVLDLRMPHEKEVLDMRDSIVVHTEGEDDTGTTV